MSAVATSLMGLRDRGVGAWTTLTRAHVTAPWHAPFWLPCGMCGPALMSARHTEHKSHPHVVRMSAIMCFVRFVASIVVDQFTRHTLSSFTYRMVSEGRRAAIRHSFVLWL